MEIDIELNVVEIEKCHSIVIQGLAARTTEFIASADLLQVHHEGRQSRVFSKKIIWTSLIGYVWA